MIVDDNIEILDEYMEWENQADDPTMVIDKQNFAFNAILVFITLKYFNNNNKS